jgi:hypothetical protein
MWLQGFFLWQIFVTWRQKKGGGGGGVVGESNKGTFENFLKPFAISPEKKRLEVTRFRQGVPLGRQN